jgi:pseudoazurin|tara:strand:+ start:375 stop:809 length:435 start_codon:yes stop_codon:yes gene_type:complete
MKYILVLFFTLWTGLAWGADVTVEMLNKLNKEYMVYSKKIIHIDVGDTVFWKSVDSGHNVEFIKGAVPEGVEKFKSKLSKDTEYTFTVPGIYAYWCTPHKSMGMIAFVVVGGDLSNIETISQIRYYGKSKKIASQLISEINSKG